MKVLMLIARGFEDVEAVTVLDYLDRAGIGVEIAGLDAENGLVRGAHGSALFANADLGDLRPEDYAGVLLPGGGKNAAALAANEQVGRILTRMAALDKYICAVCAAPALVLSPLGLLQGKHFTCYPGMEEGLSGGGLWNPASVVVDGRLITSRAAGTAASWSLAIISALAGPGCATRVAGATLQ
jgi:4-methyl-5(b-hydroxyethyl)-thiazole monophosphate biosynthesis